MPEVHPIPAGILEKVETFLTARAAGRFAAMSDDQFWAMCADLPVTLDELLSLPGISCDGSTTQPA